MWLAREKNDALGKSGNPLVFRGTKWWNVCDKGFSYHEANAVCREMGLPHGIPLIPLTSTPVEEANTFQIAFMSLSCPDNATGLAECSQTIEQDCRESFVHPSTYASVLCVHTSSTKNGTFISL